MRSSARVTIVEDMRPQLSIATFVLAILLFSCDSDFISKRLPTDIYEVIIPAQGPVNQNIQILVKIEAFNGCYSDLKAELVQIDSRHFLIKSTGLFQTTGSCPAIMVYDDTTMTFRPSMTGRYFFQFNEEDYNLRRDTIDIY
jgi:hypothetical protein